MLLDDELLERAGRPKPLLSLTGRSPGSSDREGSFVPSAAAAAVGVAAAGRIDGPFRGVVAAVADVELDDLCHGILCLGFPPLSLSLVTTAAAAGVTAALGSSAAGASDVDAGDADACAVDPIPAAIAVAAAAKPFGDAGVGCGPGLLACELEAGRGLAERRQGICGCMVS